MSDFASAFPESGTAHGEIRDDAPGASAHPQPGSPLDALVRRQAAAPGSDRRLGFVPAQVR